MRGQTGCPTMSFRGSPMSHYEIGHGWSLWARCLDV